MLLLFFLLLFLFFFCFVCFWFSYVLLLAMRPRDPRYDSIPLAAAPNVDATVTYAAMRSPISNTFARYENAERRHNEGMVKNNKVFFNPWETIHESNPQGNSRARGKGHPGAVPHHARRPR